MRFRGERSCNCDACQLQREADAREVQAIIASSVLRPPPGTTPEQIRDGILRGTIATDGDSNPPSDGKGE